VERVWIVSEELYARRESVPQNRHAEVVVVENLRQFREQLAEGERAVLLGSLPVIAKAREEFPRLLGCHLLPRDLSQERLLFSVRAALREARLQHDLEAAENIAWSGVGVGQYDDPGLELLGSSILELSAARDMASVEEALQHAVARIVPVQEVRVVAYPETATSRNLGLYQLAVPVQFQGELRAHIYVRFDSTPEQPILEKVSEALLNLSDAVSLAVERNIMISKAEETKTVWEASFDSVEDPVVILGDDYRVLRGNRAFGRFVNVPLVKLAGREPMVVPIDALRAQPADVSSEWSVEYNGHHYRAYLDPISAPLGAGRFVLRFHDITEERTLTEKILAKEQVAELGILVGSVAHEINNPIGGILAIGQILQKDIEPGTPLAEDVGNIVQAAERCRKIIQTMLSLVRKADEERRNLPVTECVQSALDLLGSEAKRLQVKVRLEVGNGDSLVSANANRLLQVFFHLLQHSLLALGERRARGAFEAYLTVSVIPGFGNVEVRIEDNGDGVKHEYEIQSSVAFTVSKMILEEHEAGFFFTKAEGRNQQRIVFQTAER
jgi:two-component system, NtrC family, sensor kinase